MGDEPERRHPPVLYVEVVSAPEGATTEQFENELQKLAEMMGYPNCEL